MKKLYGNILEQYLKEKILSYRSEKFYNWMKTPINKFESRLNIEKEWGMKISKFEYKLVKLYMFENSYNKNINKRWKEAFHLNYDDENKRIN